MHNSNNLGNDGITKECVDKFGADIPDNLRGTDEFTRRYRENIEKGCDKSE